MHLLNCIYFLNSLGDLTAIDTETGNLIWQTPTQSSAIYENYFSLKNSDLIFQGTNFKDIEKIENKINNFKFVQKSIPMIEAQILALGDSQSSGGLLRGIPFEKLSKIIG